MRLASQLAAPRTVSLDEDPPTRLRGTAGQRGARDYFRQEEEHRICVSLKMGKAEMETEDLAAGGRSGGRQSAPTGDMPAFQVARWGTRVCQVATRGKGEGREACGWNGRLFTCSCAQSPSTRLRHRGT